MKVDELRALCLKQAEAPQEDDEEYPEDTGDDTDDLSEALIQLDNAWALLDGLADHFSVPRARMNKYLLREIIRVAGENLALLSQYDMEEIRTNNLIGQTVENICQG